MGIPMGIGRLGSPNLIIKKKNRFLFKLYDICGGGTIPESFVKVASRPNWTVEETELNFLNAKTFIPGKVTYETMTVTYIDVASLDQQYLWNWLASVYNFTDPVNLQMGSMRRDYSAKGILTMYSGCGDPLEQWNFEDVWPTGVNFGEVDMSSSEESTIELTLRYSNVSYKSLCPNFTPTACCSPCNS